MPDSATTHQLFQGKEYIPSIIWSLELNNTIPGTFKALKEQKESEWRSEWKDKNE